MSREMENTSDKQFYGVLDGTFRTRVREGTEGALERINKNGVQVFERETKALFGRIENIAFESKDFGSGNVKSIVITLDANEDGKHPVLTFGLESKNGRDVLKKLPAIDFSKEVRIMPYSFEEGTEKASSGISIYQPDDEDKFTVKVGNFFFDPETKKYLHNFPTIDWDSASESEQKIYKIKRDEFLVKYAEENVVSKFTGVSTRKPEALEAEFKKPAAEAIHYPDPDINPEDIPF